MIRVGGEHIGEPGKDTEFHGLFYPDGDIITRHMAERLRAEPFYQHDKLMDVLPRVRRRRLAVDCGAWVGGWSRELARHFQRVLVVEANSNNARCVVANTRDLGNVTVLNAAVFDQSGRGIAGAIDGGANVGSRVVLQDEQGSAVDLVRLDTVLQSVPAVDYIKIHVNGMELRALRGGAEIIRQHRPVLTVVLKPAITDYGDSLEAARAFLTNDLHYRCAGGERPYEIWVPK